VPASAHGIAFDEIRVQQPQLDEVAAAYRDLRERWETARDTNARLEVFNTWDALRRRLSSWAALTRLRFDQDTTDSERKRQREFLDEISPKLLALESDMQRRLLSSPHRGELEGTLGRHLLTLWQDDVAAFDPVIEADLTLESKLESRYTELIAGARLEIEGAQVNMAGLEPYLQHRDRDVRHRAHACRDAFFGAHAAELDTIYDDLVRIRHRMARTLGYENFIGLAYKRLHRTDFTSLDVERYRDEVVRHVVPLAQEIVERRRGALGIDELRFWDESMASPEGNPVPRGDDDWVVARGRSALGLVHPEIGEFYEMMVAKGLVDLHNREGKAGGGYCTGFADYGLPYIFANFNGTHGDVHVLVHEMGHAFQDWKSRMLPAYDYLTPTYESAEIHSMSIEYLASPHMELFFEGDAERYRRQQLEDAMLFLPYGVAVDHFQHLVYAAPERRPEERHAMWLQMEKRYLPWRRYGDLQRFAAGSVWQAKSHIYQAPFYYIDYTLALCCALQFWARSRRDYASAVADYVSLCARGGEAAFADLVRSANLRSPFEEGVLAQVVGAARDALTLS